MSSSRRLPVVVDVPNPCEVDWEDMIGDERGRYCGRCQKTVRNLSVLDGDEIAVVLERGDCVSFLYREDASIITAESGVSRGTAAFAPAAAVVLAATMALTLGCDVGRTTGDPLPPARVAAAAASAARQNGAAAASTGTQNGATAISAEPASSTVAPRARASASAEPAASCTPSSKPVKKAEPGVPSERPRRTAGIPMRHKD